MNAGGGRCRQQVRAELAELESELLWLRSQRDAAADRRDALEAELRPLRATRHWPRQVSWAYCAIDRGGSTAAVRATASASSNGKTPRRGSPRSIPIDRSSSAERAPR